MDETTRDLAAPSGSGPITDTEGDAPGVAANARITGTMGATLFVLFALEGLTVLAHVRGVLSTHVFLGMLLVPPVLVKTASTSYRIVQYYRGDPNYVRKGPPPLLLRLLGPFVIATTFLVIGTGVVLLLAGPDNHLLSAAHKASFILWFGAMTIHVLGHLRETPALAGADYRPRSRPVPGADRPTAAAGGRPGQRRAAGRLVHLVDRHRLAPRPPGLSHREREADAGDRCELDPGQPRSTALRASTPPPPPGTRP